MAAATATIKVVGTTATARVGCDRDSIIAVVLFYMSINYT